MTDNLIKHPKCPCDECWCVLCVNSSKGLKTEIESRKQEFIESENHKKMVKETQDKKNRLKPIADGIRKKHRVVYRFKRTGISFGLDGYDSPSVSNFYYGVFSSYENVEKFIGSQKIKDDIVVVKSDKLSDEEIVELDKCLEGTVTTAIATTVPTAPIAPTAPTAYEHYGC